MQNLPCHSLDVGYCLEIDTSCTSTIAFQHPLQVAQAQLLSNIPCAWKQPDVCVKGPGSTNVGKLNRKREDRKAQMTTCSQHQAVCMLTSSHS